MKDIYMSRELARAGGFSPIATRQALLKNKEKRCLKTKDGCTKHEYSTPEISIISVSEDIITDSTGEKVYILGGMPM